MTTQWYWTIRCWEHETEGSACCLVYRLFGVHHHSSSFRCKVEFQFARCTQLPASFIVQYIKAQEQKPNDIGGSIGAHLSMSKSETKTIGFISLPRVLKWFQLPSGPKTPFRPRPSTKEGRPTQKANAQLEPITTHRTKDWESRTLMKTPYWIEW